jgi:hypothetical protein
MPQDFTYIDPGGNQAQYTIYDVDSRTEYHWATDHGDRGFARSYAEAQSQARNAIKASMTIRRRSPQTYR